jgi:hypothetical protein
MFKDGKTFSFWKFCILISYVGEIPFQEMVYKDTVHAEEMVYEEAPPVEEEVYQEEVPVEEEVYQEDAPVEEEVYQEEAPVEEEVYQEEAPVEEEVYQEEAPVEAVQASVVKASPADLTFYQGWGSLTPLQKKKKLKKLKARGLPTPNEDGSIPVFVT